MASKKTAYGAFMARRASKLQARSNRASWAGIGLSLAGTAGLATGNFVLGGVAHFASAGAHIASSAVGKKAAVASTKGRAIGGYVHRLSLARAAAKRSSTVMRAAQTLNRSTRRAAAAAGGSDGTVKGYYRSQGGQRVFVQEHNRGPR